MPLTKVDTRAALIAIDIQKGIAALPTAHPSAGIIERAARLARAFRERCLPVVIVNVSGRPPGRTDSGTFKFSPPPDWAEFVPELQPQKGDYTVTKQRVGAFTGTSLDEFLRRSGVTQVFLAGIATSAGVESTARNSYDLGYNVVLVVDAMTDLNADAHDHSIKGVFPRLGETASTEDVLNMLSESAPA